MLFAAVPPAVDAFVERFGERLDPAHLALVQRLAPLAPAATEAVWKPPFVVGHGDYRLDNMLFGTAEGAPAISVIDWQAARLAPPLLDAAIFLGSCLRIEDRREHERALLGEYHEGLLAGGVTGFSLEDCWESYRGSSLYPFLITVAVSVTLQRTERGDAMWARLLSGCAEIVLETGAGDLLTDG
jgi:aminoglycoside phosphotransferase (APT) family kinase protein